MLRWLLAAVHLIAFGIGTGAIWSRTVALKGDLSTPKSLAPVFKADGFWALAAVLWVTTGIARALWFEKGTAYYLHNWLFHAKMALFLLVVLLELKPMMTLIRWRQAVKRGEMPDTSGARPLFVIGMIQAHVLVVMVLIATALARGFGGR